MAELTAFGKEVRKLRIEKGASLMDMAAELKCSAAFVSAVETGRKDPPEEFVVQVAKFFKLPREEAAVLHKLALQSRNVVRLRPQPRNREVVAEFARKFETLGNEEMADILTILRRVSEK